MLVLAHTGITLGMAVLVSSITQRNSKSKSDVLAWLASFSARIDYRILLIGSILPDIIDKPIGGVLFRDELSSGRIYAHTLLFLLLLSVVGFLLYRYRGSIWGLVLAFGTFIHHILDQIWLMPETMLWPIFGLEFERLPVTDWLSLWFSDFFSRPDIFVPELIGLGVLLWWGIVLLNQKRVGVFIRYGKNN